MNTSLIEESFVREHPGPFGVPQNITEYVGAHICGNSLFTDLCAEITFATDGRDPKQTNYVIIVDSI